GASRRPPATMRPAAARATDRSIIPAREVMGGTLAQALRASWLPKITTGWFFRAESFFSVARYLDQAAQEPRSGPPPDFLSHSHGEDLRHRFAESGRLPGSLNFIAAEPDTRPSAHRRFVRPFEPARSA